jgi:hypothetical protein
LEIESAPGRGTRVKVRVLCGRQFSQASISRTTPAWVPLELDLPRLIVTLVAGLTLSIR